MGLQSVKEGFMAGLDDQGFNLSPECIPLQNNGVGVYSGGILGMSNIIQSCKNIIHVLSWKVNKDWSN